MTALLRIEDVSAGIATGRLRGRIEVYAADAATTVESGGRNVPLELEPTAALAYQLEGAPSGTPRWASSSQPSSRRFPKGCS